SAGNVDTRRSRHRLRTDAGTVLAGCRDVADRRREGIRLAIGEETKGLRAVDEHAAAIDDSRIARTDIPRPGPDGLVPSRPDRAALIDGDRGVGAASSIVHERNHAIRIELSRFDVARDGGRGGPEAIIQ